MSNHTFSIYDATLSVRLEPTAKDQFGMWLPNWDNHVRLLRVLKQIGFSIEADPKMLKHYRSIAKYNRIGRRGDLFVYCRTCSTGSEFEFYQEIVTVNPNGGRYDFDKVGMMPYLIRKSFERAVTALKADLLAHGFADRTKYGSPVSDPLAYFNDRWDCDDDKQSGTHRFERDESGWPSANVIGNWGRRDRDGNEITHGAVRYARDLKGYLMRGRVYGGINGRWMLIYGPGSGDYTYLDAGELFTCSPATTCRKKHHDPSRGKQHAVNRLRQKMAQAVTAEDFETAARLRDQARRIESHIQAA